MIEKKKKLSDRYFNFLNFHFDLCPNEKFDLLLFINTKKKKNKFAVTIFRIVLLFINKLYKPLTISQIITDLHLGFLLKKNSEKKIYKSLSTFYYFEKKINKKH